MLPLLSSSNAPPLKARDDALSFPASSAAALEPYLPPTNPSSITDLLPFTTLTFATSLDSAIALAPGTQTALSGPDSKAMTHYLRARHAAILVGAGTAVADDPGLNCRIAGAGGYGGEGLEGQPRPVVVDPAARWSWVKEEEGGGRGESALASALAKVLRLAGEGRGRAPWILIAEGESISKTRREALEGCGGRVIEVKTGADRRMEWRDILEILKREGIESVMVEGGARIINALLEPGNIGLVDSVIVTITPTWLGEGSVVVSPPRRMDTVGRAVPAARLKDIKWCPLGEDVVLCGRLQG